MNKLMVTVVGPWPSPIGGVSTFTSRLIKKDNNKHVIELIDIYSGEKRNDLPPKLIYRTPLDQSFLKWFWLWNAVRNSKGNVVHFNFAGSKSLFLLVLLFKKRKQKWVLTLHSGNLVLGSIFKNIIFRLIVKKIDTIVSLSSKQKTFYNSIGRFNLINSTSYIYIPPERANANESWTLDWKNKSLNFKYKFIASGYPFEIYNHMHTINSITAHENAFLTLFLYGPDSQNLLEKLKEKSQLKNCMVYYGKSETDFNYILKESDIYVRPNSSDSFGIAVADAVNCNLIVLASDVCKRYQGAITFSTLEEYDELIVKIINEKLIKKESVNNYLDSYEDYINIYKNLSS